VYSAKHLFSLLFPTPTPILSLTSPSNNHLQLPRISKRVLNDLIARDQDVLALIVVLLLGEVYPAVLDDPTGFAREVDDAAFRVEEQQGLGVRDGNRGVCALAARGDLLADCADEDLANR
jgi:hypothetical protein